MTDPALVRYADRQPAPWANGRGSTTELIGWSESGELTGRSGPSWRLSIARLDGPAAFSPLPAVDRHFLPVGADVDLRIDGVVVPIVAGTVQRFSGDADVDLVRLARTPAHAVNLMSRAGSGAGPTLVVTDTADLRCARGVVAVVLADGPDGRRFDVIRPSAARPEPPHGLPPTPVALVLPGAG